MKITFHYGDGVLSLPAAVAESLPRAEGDAARVLLYLAGAAQSGANPSREKIASALSLDGAAVDAAVAFWRGAGILDTDTKASRPAPQKQPEKAVPQSPARESKNTAATVKPTSPAAPPRYTSEELANLLETRRELRTFLDECGQLLGKILSAHETNTLLSLMDYLNVDSEYLLLLLAHCVRIGKKSVHYLENCAVGLYDEGIVDATSLQECLKQREILEEAEGSIRTMFGMKSRALTSKEQKMIETWILTWKFDMDVIRRAYEMTVNATQSPSVPYANSILERWATSGLHTLAEIEAADAIREGKKPNASPDSSFNIDDFFQAALRRSLGDDFVPPEDLAASAAGNRSDRGKKGK